MCTQCFDRFDTGFRLGSDRFLLGVRKRSHNVSLELDRFTKG